MEQQAPAFETRCPRCDVSYPVETRKCIHCGGPTGQANSLARFSIATDSPYDGFDRGIESDSDEFVTDPMDREFEVAEEPSSMGRSLVKSLGGFIWIIALIGFTLARNCGGE
jgi:hypothetical protein